MLCTSAVISEELQMTIRIATIADITQLLNISMRTFSDSRAEMSPCEIESKRREIRRYFEVYLRSPLSRTWVAEVNHEVVSLGTITFFVRAARPSIPAAIEAYLANIYTQPEYRRQGYATTILTAAKSYAQSQGINRIWLHTTEAGRPVYEAAGFQNAAA